MTARRTRIGLTCIDAIRAVMFCAVDQRIVRLIKDYSRDHWSLVSGATYTRVASRARQM